MFVTDSNEATKLDTEHVTRKYTTQLWRDYYKASSYYRVTLVILSYTNTSQHDPSLSES